jgi:2'-5' RNA ligase
VPEETASNPSLWLVPEPRWEARFAKLIDGLSAEWGTPRFAPHVTLLGNVKSSEREIRAEAARLAAELGPIRLRFLEIGWSDQFYRAFYVVVEREPALLRARAAATEALQQAPASDYLPHLSLAYGKLAVEPRKQAVARIGTGFGTCRAERLEVVRTIGPPETWETLAAYPLRRPD